MAKVSTYFVNNYESDWNGTFTNVPFKQKAGFANLAGIDENYIFRAPSSRNCSPQAALFTMRRLRATFVNANDPKDQASVEYPIPATSQIPTMIAALRANGAVCIDLLGEEWYFVPPAVGEYEPSRGNFTLPTTAQRDPKITGQMPDYGSDIFNGDVASPIRPVEPLPAAEFTTAIETCFGTLQTRASLPCGLGSGFLPRAVIWKGLNQDNGNISRTITVKRKDEVKTCMQAFAGINGLYCFGYQGESSKRVDLIAPGVTGG